MERESPKQTPLTAEPEPEVGLDLMTLRSGPEPRPRVRGLTDCITQAPRFCEVLKIIT